MTNLIDTILGALPADTGDRLGAIHGESPDTIVKGLSGIVPLLLASFAGKAAAGGGISGPVDLIRSTLAGGNPLDAPEGLLSGGAAPAGISGLAAQLLGPQTAPIVAAIAGYFGLKGTTVNSLLSLGGPLVAGGIGKLLGGVPTENAVRELLTREKSDIVGALPGPLQALVAPPAVAAPAAAVVEEATGPGTWKWLLLGLIVLGALAWLFFGRGHKEEVPATVATPAVIEQAPVEPAPVAAPVGAGVVTEERAGRPVLIVFFDVAKSDVTNDVAVASSAVKAYADANPGSKLSVSGYNDPTGDPVANAALSKSRAEGVKAALVAAGIGADRIDLDKPAAATDTTDTYAAARRVEVTVKE